MKRIRRSVQQLHAYVPGEQPRAANVVKLNTNENPYPPSPSVTAAIRKVPASALRLYPQPTSADLRAAIAKRHRCRPENIFVGNGSDEVLALCARAFVEKNGSVGYFEPSYSLYPVLAAIEELATRPVPLGGDFAWTMPRGYKADLFYLTNPNAPTSLLFPKKEIAAFCGNFKGVVLIDEAYVDFAPANCLDLALKRPNVLVARTLSKSYSLAGIRLGYAVGPAPLIGALDKIKDSYNVSRLTQAIALAAIRDPSHMRRNVKKIIATREKTASALRACGWTVFPSATNFLWAKPAGVGAAELFQQLRRKNIFVRYFPGPRTGAHLRITIGTDAQMRKLLSSIDG